MNSLIMNNLLLKFPYLPIIPFLLVSVMTVGGKCMTAFLLNVMILISDCAGTIVMNSVIDLFRVVEKEWSTLLVLPDGSFFSLADRCFPPKPQQQRPSKTKGL